MQHGQTVTPDALTDLARQAFEASGLTQSAAAAQLGVSQPTFSQAIREHRRSLGSLRVRIVEAFTAFRVEGPEYRLVEKSRGAGDAGA